jgi:hypothetical protein
LHEECPIGRKIAEHTTASSLAVALAAHASLLPVHGAQTARATTSSIEECETAY